jgi:hypothetical protein
MRETGATPAVKPVGVTGMQISVLVADGRHDAQAREYDLSPQSKNDPARPGISSAQPAEFDGVLAREMAQTSTASLPNEAAGACKADRLAVHRQGVTVERAAVSAL